jgi:zinc protease
MTQLRLRISACVVALVLAAPIASMQTPSAPSTGRETSAASVASYPLSQQMPVDPDVTVGTLPNGLRYYVRANGKPARRAELRLVVKAGSVLEDDDQKGLAHYVEHMLFEGTRNFPGKSLIDFLSSLGLSIGPDANAATSYDTTQYTLRVPTDVPNALERALLVLQDWAQGATFDQSGIDRERPIVLSEWRQNLGSGVRTQDAIRRVQLAGSRYADRPVIGDPNIIEYASRDALVRFYRDWYRPDLMAVIVVGDVDRNAMAAMIGQRFSSLRNPSPARPRPFFDVAEQPGTRYAIVTDKETTATLVALSNLRPARNQGSVGGYRTIIRDQLFADMLSARLDELRQRDNPPLLRAAAERALFPAPNIRDEAVLQALVAGDGVGRGLEALVTELQRVKRFGFTASELARAKQARMGSYERAVTESPDRESPSRADEYTRNFLNGEALPTIWQELAFHRRFVPSITLDEVNALPADWFPDRNRLIIVSAPESSKDALPEQAQLAAAVRAAETGQYQPYVDVVAEQALMALPPARGTIVRTTPRLEAGITEWTLSNGATIVLKPTKLKEDQILFRASASGGTSLASDADFPSARVAGAIVPAGGVGQFSQVTLDKLLSGKAVAVAPFIGEISHGMRGGSTPQDLETMFQLLHLRFTQPRADPASFAAMRLEAKALVANQDSSPDVVFDHAIDAALSGNNARRQPESTASVDQWNLQTALAFYKARFADAGNFTFVFVGSFDLETIKPLVETYIASLPATHAGERARDLGLMPPTGVVEKKIEKGIAPKSQVAIVLSGPIEYNDEQRLALRAVTLVLQSRLFDTIRQELGGTYSITAAPYTQKLPRPFYQVRIEWTADPAKTETLVQRVQQEIAYVRDLRFAPGQMAAIRSSLTRDFERDSQDNGYLLNQIARHYEDGEGETAAAIEDLPARIAALTSATVERAVQTYLGTANYVKVTLMPERTP